MAFTIKTINTLCLRFARESVMNLFGEPQAVSVAKFPALCYYYSIIQLNKEVR